MIDAPGSGRIAVPVCSNSTSVSHSTPSATRATPGGWLYRVRLVGADEKSRLVDTAAPATSADGDVHSSVDASTNDATTRPSRKSHSDSTPVRLTKPAPRTVSAVPPNAGPDTTLTALTVALWYVNSTPSELYASELIDTSTASTHAPAPHRAAGVVHVRRPSSSIAATTTAGSVPEPSNLQR